MNHPRYTISTQAAYWPTWYDFTQRQRAALNLMIQLHRKWDLFDVEFRIADEPDSAAGFEPDGARLLLMLQHQVKLGRAACDRRRRSSNDERSTTV